MYGNLHLPPNSTAISITEFKGSDGASQGEAYKRIYNVPKNATFLHIFLVAGGGSGGRPTAGAATAAAGGGGSSCIVQGLFPVMQLPDTLWIVVGGTRAGATTNATSGTVGRDSVVTMYALPTGNINAGNCLLIANAGGGGNQATTGGSAGAAMTSNNAKWSTLGLWTSQIGVAGGAGAAGAGTAVAFNALLPLTGGGGGAGSNSGLGGGITAQAGYTQIPAIAGGAAGGAGNGGAGNAGMGNPKPWCGTGGTGGGGSTTLAGGAGANAGWYGCGGGGGGNGLVTSGNGGNGGPGYCLIVAF